MVTISGPWLPRAPLEVMPRVAAAAVVFRFAPCQSAHNGLSLAPEDDAALALHVRFAEHSIRPSTVAVELLDRELAGLHCHVVYSVLPYVYVIALDSSVVNH